MSTLQIMYGTAWKEERTTELTVAALQAGFRAIDTANQRKHYHEAGVGKALAEMLAAGVVTREELFLQSKFTHLGGQDHRLPYDPDAPVGDQVAQSFERSLEHLQITALDSLVLHGPSRRDGLADVDWEAWQAMEAVHAAGKTRHLGISNVNLKQLRQLVEGATVAPTFVQNRCFAVNGWDYKIRTYCNENNMVYQGFSLLTANRQVLQSSELESLARAHNLTECQLVFAFAKSVGMIPLTGTSDPHHMQQDLEAIEITLGDDAIRTIESIAIPKL